MSESPQPDMVPTEKRTRGRRSAAEQDKELANGLAAVYGAAGALWMLVNNYDGLVVLLTAQSMAEADLAACKPYPEAMRVLKIVARGNVWTTLVAAHLAPTMAILANHGVVRREIAPRFKDSTGQPLPMPPEREAPSTAAPFVDEDTLRQMAAEAEQTQAQQEAIQRMYANGQTAQPAQQQGEAGLPLGDANEVAARQMLTEQQIASIREQSIAAAIAQIAAAQNNPDMIPPATHNPGAIYG